MLTIYTRQALGVLVVTTSMGQAHGVETRISGPPTDEVESIQAAPPVTPTVSTPYAAIPEVPDAEKVAFAQKTLEGMQKVLAAVQKMHDDATEDRDVIKLNCVAVRLTAITDLLEVSVDSVAKIPELLAQRETELAAHELEKIVIAGRKVTGLRAEAEGCLGELAVYSGETSTSYSADEVKEDDPTTNTGDTEVITRPAFASPFQ